MRKLIFALIISLFLCSQAWGAVDVGSNAQDAAGVCSHNYTYITLVNPANESGTIDTIAVTIGTQAATGQTLKFGVFYLVSGTTYACRSYVSLTLTGAIGSTQTFTAPTDFAAFNVSVGDYAGFFVPNSSAYHVVGKSTDNAGSGFRWVAGDATGGGNFDFTGADTNDDFSVYMTGGSEPPPSGNYFFADRNLSADCSGNYSIANRTCTGSDGTAYNTISEAITAVSAGGTVYVRSGTYGEKITISSSKDGTQSTPITIRNYGSEEPLISGSGSNKQVEILGDWIVWDNIDSASTSGWGFWVEGAHVTIQNSKSYSNTEDGIIAFGNNLTVSQCEIYSNGWNGVSVTNCHNSIITKNKIYNNTSHMGIQIVSTTAGIYPNNHEISYNKVYNNSNGLYLCFPTNTVIKGNVIYDHTYHGISFNYMSQWNGPTGYTSNCSILNNTIVGNSDDGIGNTKAGSLTVKNNIFAYNASDDIRMSTTGGHDIDYNLYYNTVSLRWGSTAYTTLGTWQAASSQDANSPAFADPSFTNYAGKDFTLAAASPAIGVGVDLGDTYAYLLDSGSVWPLSVSTRKQDANGLPDQAVCASPADAAVGVSITPTLLTAGTFSITAGTWELGAFVYSQSLHTASQWLIDEDAGDFSTPVYDSTEDATDLVSDAATGLAVATAYDWKVRFKSDAGWGSYSTVRGFTTEGAVSTDYTLSINNVTVNEQDGIAVLTVSCSPTIAVGDSVTVDVDTSGGTATAGYDYTAISGGTATIAAGEYQANVVISIANDKLRESQAGAETFNVVISNLVCTGTCAGSESISDDTGVVTINEDSNDWTARTVYVDVDITDTYVASASPDFTAYDHGNFTTTGGTDLVYKTLADIGACSLVAGDVVLLKKGETWNEALTVPSSGSASGQIRFGAFGTGALPIIDAQDARASAATGNAKNYLTFQYIDFRNGTTADLIISGTNNIVEYCTTSSGAIGIQVSGTPNTIRYNTIGNDAIGGSDSGGTNVWMYNIFNAQTNDGLLVTAAASLIYNNTFYNQTDDGIELQANATIKNCVFEAVGGTDIFENGGSATVATNYASADGDPLFTTPGSDFTPQEGSPLLNTGTNLGTTYALDSAGTSQNLNGLPSQAVPTSPADTATGVPVSPTFLTAGSFSIPSALWDIGAIVKVGSTHTYSQWQIDEDGQDFSVPVWDSTATTDLLSDSTTGLANNTPYDWRVRFKSGVGWGAWSSTMNFTTVAATVGNTYYANPSGSGTTCSEGSPCTLEYAVETKATSGDTVIAQDGTYPQGAPAWSCTVDDGGSKFQGTLDVPSWVEVKAANRQLAIITAYPVGGTGTDWCAPAVSLRGSNSVLDGFKVQGEVAVVGSGHIVRNCDLYSGGEWTPRSYDRFGCVLRIEGTTGVLIQNNILRDNQIAGSTDLNSPLIQEYSSNGLIIENNDFLRSVGPGLRLKDRPNNTIARRNFFLSTALGAIEGGNQNTGTNVSLYQNVMVNCGGGIRLRSFLDTVAVYNNTIYNSTQDGAIRMSGPQNLSCFNNIIYLNGGTFFHPTDGLSGTDIDYNDYNTYYGTSNWKSANAIAATTLANWRTYCDANGKSGDNQGDDNSVSTDPGFTNAGGTTAEDYKRASYTANGRGGSYSSVQGAYLDGTEVIGYDGGAAVTSTDYALSINNVTVNEADGTATFTVSVAPALSATDSILFNYSTSDDTATAGNDYTAVSGGSGQIALAGIVTTIAVTILDDYDPEDTTIGQTFNVVISNARCMGDTCGTVTLTDATGVGTITEDLTDYGGTTVYYVDPDITDTNVASATPDFTTYNPTTFSTTTGTDWVYKTIADINACSLDPGAYVLFKKGETWRETLTVPSSGSDGLPIIFGAYGSGADPVVSGTDIITSWSLEEGVPIVAEQSLLGGYPQDLRDEAASIYWTQGFESDSAIDVPYVDVYIQKVASPTGNIWLEIWNTTGTPARYSSIAATSSSVDVSTVGGALAYVRFTFSPSVSISSDTAYFIALAGDWTIDGTNYIRWDLYNGDNYRGGDPYSSIRLDVSHGITWNPGYEMRFKIFKDVAGTVYSKAGITTEPHQVFYNGVRLAENDGATNTVGLNEWDWAANILYINIGEDPAGGTVEASQRNYVAVVGDHDYVTLDGLHFTKGNNTNVTLYSGSPNNVIIQNCESSWAVGYGIGISIAALTDGLIYNNTIHDNFASGIFAYKHDAGAGHENYIRGNTIYNCGTVGNEMGIYVIANYYVIEDNHLYDNGNVSGLCNGIELFNGDDDGYAAHNIIRRNIVHGQISGTNDGTGIAADNLSSYNDIYYNIAYNNDGCGFGIWKSNNINLFNNVSYDNVKDSAVSHTLKTEIDVGSDAADTSNIVVKNNVAVATEADTYAIYLDANTYDSSGLSITNNAWYATAANWYFWNATGGNVLATWNALTGVGTDLNSDPLFLDAASADFTLKPASPCRDTGVDVGLTEDYLGNPIRGPAPEMGVYEYNSNRGIVIN